MSIDRENKVNRYRNLTSNFLNEKEEKKLIVGLAVLTQNNYKHVNSI